MTHYSAQDLVELLNKQDECNWIEAKGGHEPSHSVMEKVCAFANEPGLGGGYILLGAAEDKTSSIPYYKTINIADPDKSQSALPPHLSTLPSVLSVQPPDLSTPPPEILERIAQLNEREHDTEKVKNIIVDLCAARPMKAVEIAGYFSKNEGYIKRKYLKEMIADKQLSFLYPEMINHPEQAYRVHVKE